MMERATSIPRRWPQAHTWRRRGGVVDASCTRFHRLVAVVGDTDRAHPCIHTTHEHLSRLLPTDRTWRCRAPSPVSAERATGCGAAVERPGYIPEDPRSRAIRHAAHLAGPVYDFRYGPGASTHRVLMDDQEYLHTMYTTSSPRLRRRGGALGCENGGLSRTLGHLHLITPTQ